MKKLLTCILLLTVAVAAKATHLMGGEITAKRMPGGRYKITLTYYRDTLGVPLVGTESVDVFAMSNMGGGGINMVYPGLQLKFDTVASQALVSNFPYGVQTGVYTRDSVALPTGIYRIISNSCCRNGAILNASNPLSEALVLYTDVTVTNAGNSTPEFLAMPIAHFAVNTTTTYNPMPYDPDADSISWGYNLPLGSYSSSAPTAMGIVNGFMPLRSSSTFSMNAVTGEITWTPTVTGNFIESFKVNEYKNGVLTGTIIRDMQYVVLPQDTSNMPPSFTMVSSYQTNTQQGYYYNYYTPGQQYVFKIRGTSPSARALLTMNSYGEPYQMANPGTFTVTGNGNDITGTFTWTPPASLTRDMLVSFRVGNGTFTKDFTLMLKKNSNTSVRSIGGLTAFSVYPNPVHREVNILAEFNAGTDGTIGLYNTLGQQVKTLYTGTLGKGKLRLSAPLDVAPGTYFILVKSSDGGMKSARITVE